MVSIFVNPTQFGPHEDFTRYPRTLDADIARCRAAGADLVFAPTPATVYPNGPHSTWVEVPGLSDVLEGASRPGHFRGVATVVLKLFEIVGPDLAVFGQKDYQQQLVIRRMVADLHVPVRIVTEPTVREPDGLAMSSRNRYLSPDERRAAAVLHRALDAGPAGRPPGRDVGQPGSTDPPGNHRIQRVGAARLCRGRRCRHPGIPRSPGPESRAVALVAARVGSTRLIDNLPLTE